MSDPQDLVTDSYLPFLEQGRAYRRRGEFAQAEELFRRASALRPALSEPLLERARLLWTRGELAQAGDLLREARDRFRDQPLPVVLLFRLLLQLGALAPAAQVIEEGCRDCPAHPLLLLAQGEIALLQRDFPGAAACYLQALDAGAGTAAVRAGLLRVALAEGRELLTAGRCDAAAFCFKRAVDLRPQEAEAHLLFAEALLRLGCGRRAAMQARCAKRLAAGKPPTRSS